MRIIDETPFQTKQGTIGLFDRLRGALKFGGSWYPELEAQKTVIPRLAKQLERGYTLIRNHTLGRSGIIVPLTLVGSAGVYVIYVTHRSGVFVANGEAWSVVDGERLRPERVNLLMRTARLARALQAYLQRQGLHRIRAIEPVLVAADPGMHIESVHPIVRVVMSDAVDHFAASLLQVPSVLSNEAAHEVVERILHPRLPQPSQPEAVPAAEAPPVPQKTSPFVNELQPVQDHQKATTWDPSELSFAFEDDSDATPMGGETSVDQLASHETTQSVSSQKPAAKPRRRLNGLQLFVLVCIGMAEICVLVAFAALIFLYR